MAFFPDGGDCTYFADPHLPRLLAIGWLERGQPYATGDVDVEVLGRPCEYQLGAWTGWQPAICLGSQACDFCHDDRSPMIKNFFVPGDALTYAAPEGIVHYVRRHRYRPPPDFCSALIASPSVNSPEYFARLRDNGWLAEVANPNGPFTPRQPGPRLLDALAKLVSSMGRRG